jgi:exopolysaccharide biosynthesis predicted pyruvyltransferase EpsI
MMLLPLSAFADIFEPWRNQHVGLVVLPGNVGDTMINMAALQLARRFDVKLEVWDGTLGYDALAISGGGNMGEHSPWQRTRHRKLRAIQTMLPVTCLPQSFYGEEPGIEEYHRVFCRERESLRYCDIGKLAPDLALGLELDEQWPPAEVDEVVALKRNAEGLFRDRNPRSDPTDGLRGPRARHWGVHVRNYFLRAAHARRIVTDRLHFAIAGLIVGREVVLLPNVYHKNRSMWETWLCRLGCGWST